jgi:hypothetical protein
VAVTGRSCHGSGLVIVLSYAYGGADKIQQSLAADASLACTSGTGIVPLCAAAAEAWRRVENRAGPGLSDLAAATIRSMVTAQVTTILAGSGKTRWCELATAPPAAAEQFLRVFSHAQFVCVHRSCTGTIEAGARANPWGLHGQGLEPFLLAYPGNTVAALAAHWATSARLLLDFEHAHPGNAYRVRYEDVVTDPGTALTMLRAALQLHTAGDDAALPAAPRPRDQETPAADAGSPVPVDLMPAPLRQRVGHLHTELGYRPL